jgi:membrane protease YdiL (CAAX protease family)
LLVFVAITVATTAISQLSSIPLLAEYTHLAIGLLFLLTAMRMAGRRADGARHYGIDLGGILSPPADDPPSGITGAIKDLITAIVRALPLAGRETLAALLAAAVVFPPFVLGFYFWHGPQRPFFFLPPEDLPSYLAAQLLVVGLPEETLFRGYFQIRLTDAFKGTSKLLGVVFSPTALVLQALLFAVVHFAADPQIVRLAVFFPALLFGWMRQWRGGVGVTILFHALCNLLSDILVRSWL